MKGLSCIPQKLRNLYDINKILAHRPWLLKKSHIEVPQTLSEYKRVSHNTFYLQKLTKGNDSWSLAEVVHAIVILTHFHSLCSFVFSCGVNQEVDQAGGYRYQTSDEVHEAVARNEYTNLMKSDPKDIPIVNDTRQQGNLTKTLI